MDCSYCRGSFEHNPNCPKSAPNNFGRRTRWMEGYSDGRRGSSSNSEDPSYSLGYDRGLVALEEAENGFNPVHEDRQW